ncbi:MAG TPA: hypothetical protein VGE98_15390 [Thermoanaerobaculia bacterium]
MTDQSFRLSAEERERHAALSPAQVRFLDFVANNPECLSEASFSKVLIFDDLNPYLTQPWPLFLDSRWFEGVGRVASDLCRLIQQLPQKVFDNDPQRMAEYFGLTVENAKFTAALIAQTDCLASTVGRGDFIGSPAALQCCEFNMAGAVGGWQIGAWQERSLSEPVIRRFLAESRLDGSIVVPIDVLFDHLVDDVTSHGLAANGELNTVLVLNREMPPAWHDYFDRRYRAVLAAHGGVAGRLVVGPHDATRAVHGGIAVEGLPVQAVIDCVMGRLDNCVQMAQLNGEVRVFNGLLSLLLSNKLNIALLSELADSDLLSASERETIRTHVPWSRRVAEEFTEHENERVYLPDLLLAARERFVLKLGESLSGAHVHIGRTTPAATWEALVEQALLERTWLVQEYVPSPSYIFLDQEERAVPHEMVWGIFAVGERFSGGFLRSVPEVLSQGGVVNQSRGARSGAIVSVEAAA